MQAAVQRIFADRIANVSMANGVLRIRMVALNGDNDFDAAGELAIPVKQLPKLIKDLNQTAENILEKHRRESALKARSTAKKAARAIEKKNPSRRRGRAA